MPTKQPCAEQASALLNEEEWRKFKERQAFTEHELKKLEETWAFTKNEIQKLKERVKLDERGHTAIEDELQKFEDDLQKLKERVQKLQNDLQKHEETVQEIDNQRRVFLEAVRGTKDAQRKYFKDYIWKCGLERSPDEMQHLVVRWAKRGDWEPLALHIEAGGIITDEIRSIFVEILRGDRKKPNNRAPSIFASLKSVGRAMFVLEGQAGGQRRQRAIDQAAERFGVDRRTIRRDLKALIGTEKKRQRAIGQ